MCVRLFLSEPASPKRSSAEMIPTKPRGGLLAGPGNFLDLVCFYDVALFDVVEAVEVDAALESLQDFPHVLVEALQRPQITFEDDAPVTDYAHFGVSRDLPGNDVAPGDGADARGAEDLAHFRGAQILLHVLGLQHAHERRFDVFDSLVDHAVGADIHT